MNNEPKSSKTKYRDISMNGLWKNNSALVQLLGLCPLLAVSTSVANGLGLGITTLLVLTASNLAASLIRNHVNDNLRLPLLIIIVASLVSCTELLMKAFTYELYQTLGIFIPLIIANSVVFYRAETFAIKNRYFPAALDGFMMGLGFTAVLICVGALREILGTGSLFNNMQLLFGSAATQWSIHLFGAHYSGIALALLPPGAFIVVGFLLAGKNYWDARAQEKMRLNPEAIVSETVVKGSKRVRTTGPVA